jgi:chromosomal replication initiator protein
LPVPPIHNKNDTHNDRGTHPQPRWAARRNAGQGLWQACVEQLAQDLPEQQFNTWIKPLTAQVAEDFSKVTLLVANRFKLDWIRAQYAGRIAALLESIYGQAVTLELALAQRESVASTYIRPATTQPTAPSDAQPQRRRSPCRRLSQPAQHRADVRHPGGGHGQPHGALAAMHVAGMPGHLYNPLFIYGGVGLGKTHLMHAVGNKLLADRPDAKVLYIHAEQFVSDVVKAYQRKTFDEFKERYHSLDLLLIDDVQFFANKDRTQEEFFNAFEALLAKKSHIVMTRTPTPRAWPTSTSAWSRALIRA